MVQLPDVTGCYVGLTTRPRGGNTATAEEPFRPSLGPWTLMMVRKIVEKVQQFQIGFNVELKNDDFF